MSALPTFDLLSERVSAGERLSDADLAELTRTPDILPIGMLADAVRRRLSGTRVTYLRVASCPCDQAIEGVVPPAAREVRIAGAPASLAMALAAVERTKAAAGDRTVAGFSWADVVRLARSDGTGVAPVLSALRDAGLEALIEVPIDMMGEPEPVLDGLCGAGFSRIRLTVERVPAGDRTAHAVVVLRDRIDERSVGRPRRRDMRVRPLADAPAVIAAAHAGRLIVHFLV